MANTNIFNVKCLYLGFLCLSYKPYNHLEKNRRYIGHLTYTAMSQLSLVIFDICAFIMFAAKPRHICMRNCPWCATQSCFYPLASTFHFFHSKSNEYLSICNLNLTKVKADFLWRKLYCIYTSHGGWYIKVLLVVSYHCWYDN